jgi:UDP-N-acetylmuramate dehydrogenase
MNIQKDVMLRNYTTMRLGGSVQFFATAQEKSHIPEAVAFARDHGVPLVTLGGGSNIIARDTLPPLCILKMEESYVHIESESLDDARVRVSAGFLWDDFVAYAVHRNLSGVEALSMIPGTCGATPVQNVGAYGADVSQTIESVHVYDTEKCKYRDLSNADCHFGYRDSVFKKESKGRYVIESVVFRLSKKDPLVPQYPRVAEVLENIRAHYPDDMPVAQIRKAIESIRTEKLPDPKYIPNAGSFFKNPCVSQAEYEHIRHAFPDMPAFLSLGVYKIPAGWLIEKAGLKGYSQHGVSVYYNNALVLTNDSATSTDSLLDLVFLIQHKVKDMFGITLDIEPEIL